jgi:membrane protease YdiL (CAAX protease family)
VQPTPPDSPSRIATEHGGETQNLAPRWHTALLVVGMVALAIASAIAARSPPAPADVAVVETMSTSFRIFGVYLPMVIVQTLLVIYVARFGRRRWALRPLLGRGFVSVRTTLVDLGLAVAGWGLVLFVERIWATYLTKPAPLNPAVAAALPHTAIEQVAWLLVALSVGFSEELVYRGYLQTQLAAFLGARSPLPAVALAALLFGAVHAEQGTSVVVRFTLYGVAFGLLAHARRSLWPAILCHALNDIVSGVVRGAS